MSHIQESGIGANPLDRYSEPVAGFCKGDEEAAFAMLGESMNRDPLDSGILSTLKCLRFWQRRKEKLHVFETRSEYGVYLERQWSYFLEEFLPRLNVGDSEEYSLTVPLLRVWVFSTALKCFVKEEGQSGRSDKMLWRKGRCCRSIGDYRNGMLLLKQAHDADPQESGVLADLADCFFLSGDEERGRAFFEEAFFLDPDNIDLTLLETPFIKELSEIVRRNGVERSLCGRWIPVYGYTCGCWNRGGGVPHQEIGKVQQRIYNLKSELNSDSGRYEKIKPLLLHCYLRILNGLLDFRKGVRKKIPEDKKRVIETVLLDMRYIDEAVYREYRERENL